MGLLSIEWEIAAEESDVITDFPGNGCDSLVDDIGETQKSVVNRSVFSPQSPSQVSGLQLSGCHHDVFRCSCFLLLFTRLIFNKHFHTHEVALS